MLVTILTSVALLAGVPPVIVGIAALTAFSPPLGLPAGAAAVVASRRRSVRRRTVVDEAEFCSGVAAELQAGASLRRAVATVAGTEPSAELAAAARRALAGAPAEEVASRLEGALPANGRRAALAFTLAAETGAGAAAVFRRLADAATRDAELRRERRSLTAQARLSAAVVGGAPVAVLLLLGANGRIAPGRGAGALEVGVTAIGGGLVVTGLFIVWLLVRRTEG